jgi:AraC-like DNA-binding protein
MPESAAKQVEYELKLSDGGVLARRKTENLAEGLHFFEDELEIKDSLTANVITCLGWLLEIVELKSGKLFFQTGVEANPKASLLTVKAKKLIDENYQIYPSIARIAGRLKVSCAHLTRQFKHDFGMSPNKYLHHLRIADATFRLSQGEQIIRISNEVGYNDLSRFYKQFRHSTHQSPKYCQAQLTSKNAKTSR